MTGKRSAAYKGKHYRNYACSRAMKSRALCSFYNGHSVIKIERAVLAYLAQFSDPELVKEHLAAVQTRELADKEAELTGVEQALSKVEGQFRRSGSVSRTSTCQIVPSHCSSGVLRLGSGHRSHQS